MKVEVIGVIIGGEGELWWWKLSDGEVLFKVDGVCAGMVGEVAQGVISHQVKVPVTTPGITAYCGGQ